MSGSCLQYTWYSIAPLITRISFHATYSEDEWQGITGRAPTQEAFSKALTDHELFM